MSNMVPPVGWTGGKWAPGKSGQTDIYDGYRIVDLGEEASASLPPAKETSLSSDPVAEKIHSIRLSLSSGLFDRDTLIHEQRKSLSQFPFVCNVCHFYSSQMSSFTWHLNSSHNERRSDMEMRCHICSFRCQRITDMIQHFNSERKKWKKKTTTTTRSTSKLNSRGSKSRSENLIESEYMRGTIFSCQIKKSIPCSHCDRKFRLRIAERAHFRQIHLDTNEPDQQEQTTHLQLTTKSTTEQAKDLLICPVCSSQHSTRGNLRQHISRHTPDLRCPSCPRTFAVRADLVKHLAVHSETKSFHCNFSGCAHSAKSIQTLRKHQKVHQTDKPFKCPECAFEAKLISNLKRHQRIHSKEKPYSCPHCEYRTGNQENLRKHILTAKKHQGLAVYCCDVCSFGCNIFCEFADHMRQQHQRSNIRSIFSISKANTL